MDLTDLIWLSVTRFVKGVLHTSGAIRAPSLKAKPVVEGSLRDAQSVNAVHEFAEAAVVHVPAGFQRGRVLHARARARARPRALPAEQRRSAVLEFLEKNISRGEGQ